MAHRINKDKIALFSTKLDKEAQLAWYSAATAFINIEENFLLKEGIDVKIIALAKGRKPFSKVRFSNFLLTVFYNKKTYKKFRKTLSTDVRFVLDHLVLNESIRADDLIKNHQITVAAQRKEKYYYGHVTFNLLPDYCLFIQKNAVLHYISSKKSLPKFSLYLPTNIRKFLIHFYKVPKEAKITPLKTIKKTDYLYNGQASIFEELPKVLAYNQLYKIKLTNAGRLQKTGLSKLKRQLNLLEFYSDSNIPQLNETKLMLIAHFVSSLSESKIGYDPLQELKHLFNNAFLKKYNPIKGVLHDLYTTNYSDNTNRFEVAKDFWEVLQKFPLEEWIAIENIERHLEHFNYEIRPIAQLNASGHVFFFRKTVNRYGNSIKERVYLNTATQYRNRLVDPTIKGMFFLFAALGLVDIAYNAPKTNKKGELIKSFYEGLVAVRLNNLGSYILGNTDVYKDASNIALKRPILSDTSLTIICDKDDGISPLLLPLFAKKVSTNRFKLDAQTFLIGINNNTQLNDKVDRFKKTVGNNLPDNWKLFFKELGNKMNPLIKISNAFIFKIPKENTELVQIIARNTEIQSLCLKAEKHHIIVLRKDLNKFKEKLQKHGYFL